MGVLCHGPTVFFDALLHYAVRHREYLVYEIVKAVVFNITRCILAGVVRAG
jgi:hypothetical protein